MLSPVLMMFTEHYISSTEEPLAALKSSPDSTHHSEQHHVALSMV